MASAAQLEVPEDDGYVSPEFDLPDSSEDEATHHKAKRRRINDGLNGVDLGSLAEQEEQALALLRRSG